MKKLLYIVLILLFTTSCAIAASNVTFEWDANTETDLAGYKLYQSDISQQYVSEPVAIIDAPATTYTLQDVLDGTHYWVLTAFDTAGNESDFSNEVSTLLDTTPPAVPTTLNINVIVKVTIQQ